jgi:hypothetical protein
MELKRISTEAESSTRLQDVQPTKTLDTKAPDVNKDEKKETHQEAEESGWGTILFTILKILLFGVAGYCYDVISKFF